MGVALSNLPKGNPGGPWHLILDEIFTGSLDTTRWKLNWYSDVGVMNNATTLAANVSVDSRGLVLKYSAANYGALITTEAITGVSPGFAYTYGFVEFALTFPNNNQCWGSGWSLGGTYGTSNYQEFDMAEPYSGDGLVHIGNQHYYSGGNQSNNDNSPVSGALGAEHVYGMNWQPGQVDFYFDGSLHRTITTNLNSTALAPVFNFGTQTAGDTTNVGNVITVRYLKVWQH